MTLEEQRRREPPPIPTSIDLQEPVGPEMEALDAGSPVQYEGVRPHPSANPETLDRRDAQRVADGALSGSFGARPNAIATSAQMTGLLGTAVRAALAKRQPPMPRDVLGPQMQELAAAKNPDVDTDGISRTTQAPMATEQPEPAPTAPSKPDEMPAPPVPEPDPEAFASLPPDAQKGRDMAGAGGDMPSAPPPDRAAQLRAAVESAQSSRDPYAATASRFIEDMRTARTGEPRNYSAAQAIEKGDAEAAAAPVRAYQMGAAQDKAALDRANILSQIAQRGMPKPVAPHQTQAQIDQEAADKHAKATEIPLPKDLVAPDAGKALDLEFKQHRNDHMNDPKAAGGLSPQAAATDARDIAHGQEKNLTELGTVAQTQGTIAGILKEIDKVAPGAIRGDPSNLPGGIDKAITSFTGGAIGSDKAQAMLQLQTRLKQYVGKEISGMVLNDAELRSLAQFLGTNALAPPEMFARAANIVRQALGRNVSARNAKFTAGAGGGNADRYALDMEQWKRAHPDVITEGDPLFADAVVPAAKAPPGTRKQVNGEWYIKAADGGWDPE